MRIRAYRAHPSPGRFAHALAAIGLAAATLTACGSPLPDVENNPIVVGADGNPTTEAIAELYAQQLEAEGLPVTRRFHQTDREEVWPQLLDGRIDVVPDYTLPLLNYLLSAPSPTTGRPSRAVPITTAAPFDAYAQLLALVPEQINVGRQSKATVDDATIIPLTSDRLNHREIAALEDVSLKLTTPELLRIQGLMETAQLTPQQAAHRWLLDVGLLDVTES